MRRAAPEQSLPPLQRAVALVLAIGAICAALTAARIWVSDTSRSVAGYVRSIAAEVARESVAAHERRFHGR